jgi:outer membrane receptor for ferrienterochelin and colicin
MMSRYRFLREGGIFENTWLNIARGINYGVEFIASSKIGTWLRLSGDYSYFKNIVEGTTPDNVVDNESYSWTGRLNAAFMFFDDLSFQITGSYRSPTSTAQGTRYGFYSVDLGGKYELFNRKLQVFARLSDLFNTSYFKFDNRGPNYKSTNEMHRESRIFIVGLTFRLNAEGRQQERKRKGDSMRDDEGFE